MPSIANTQSDVPQDRPIDHNKGSYGATATTNGAPVAAAAAGAQVGVVPPPMQHDLEVAQACLNLRQESKAPSTAAATTTTAEPRMLPHGAVNTRPTGGSGNGVNTNNTSTGPVEDYVNNGVGVGPNHYQQQQHPQQHIPSPNKGAVVGGSGGGGMDPTKAGGGGGNIMMNATMAPGMPPMPPPDMGRGGTQVGGMSMQHMPGSYMSVPSQIEFGGANGPAAGPYYGNMVDPTGGAASGHFYPQFASEEQYHAMMNGMGAMRDMSYYNMMGGAGAGGGAGGPTDTSNMMNPNSHFFPTMMPHHDSGHFNPMMGSYPPGGPGAGYGATMQQPQKRGHPDEYSMQNDYKRSRTGSPHDKAQVDNGRKKKATEKPKKGKRSSDMPRRPLRYVFTFTNSYRFCFEESNS